MNNKILKLGQLCKFKNSYVLIVKIHRKNGKIVKACNVLFPEGFIDTVGESCLEIVK